MPKSSIAIATGVFVCLAASCTSTTSTPAVKAVTEPVTYPVTDVPYTTLTSAYRPTELSEKTIADIKSGAFSITHTSQYLEFGLGVEQGPGEPHLLYSDLAPDFAEPSAAERRSLLYFFQSADPQVIDEESPIRLAGAYQIETLSGYRPHAAWTPHFIEANIRTARKLVENGGRNYDFGIILGDVADTGQQNELSWVFTSFNGGVIDPDSGINDDAVPGPGNDSNDPFHSIGLDAPWYFAFGNHEVSYSGAFPIDDAVREAAVGDRIYQKIPNVNGFNDGRTEWGEIVTDPNHVTPADPRRKVLTHAEVIQMVLGEPGEPSGHGFTQTNLDRDLGYYTFYPVKDLPLKMIVLDTLNDELKKDNSSGYLDRAQFDWLLNELNASNGKQELVIVASHHRSSDFSDLSEVSESEFVGAMQSNPYLLMHIAGHGHDSDTNLVSTGAGNARGYWELMGPATVDFPLQTRIIELVDNRDGTVSVYVTNLDHNSPEGTQPAIGRHIAAGWKQFQDKQYRDTWDANAVERNLHLVVSVDSTIAGKLDAFATAHHAPSRIESLTTLKGEFSQ